MLFRSIQNVPFLHAAWNPLHSIGMLWAMLQKIHCIQSGCTGPRCMDSTAFNSYALRCNAWNPLHSMMLHGIHCIQSGCILPRCMDYTAFNHNACNPLHSIGMFGPCCINTTAFNRDALGLVASTPLHTIGIHCATMHGILCIQ